MPKKSAPTKMDEAIHVVPDDSAAGALQRCGTQDLVVIEDRMCPGPCDADPNLHLRKRQEHLAALAEGYSETNATLIKSFWTWRAANLLGARELNTRLSEYSPERPIILWTAPCWTDRLIYWWVLNALQRSRDDWSRFWVAEPPHPRGEATFYYHAQPQLGHMSPKEHQATFAKLRRLRSVEVKAGAALWRQFASPSPLAFDRARRRGSRLFPDLRPDAEVFGGFFPRAAGRRVVKLKLSVADQQLLDALRTDRWLCVWELQRVGSAFAATGIHSYLRRLREWARHDAIDPAVIAGPGPDASDEFKMVGYRLTRRGQRLRKHGLESAKEAPPMFVGGCPLYTGDPLWVRREKGESWFIDAISGT